MKPSRQASAPTSAETATPPSIAASGRGHDRAEQDDPDGRGAGTGGDADDVGAGERVAHDRRHDRARQAERRADQQPGEDARQAQRLHDQQRPSVAVADQRAAARRAAGRRSRRR